MTIEHISGLSESAWLSMRRNNINSSEVAALWGWSPFMSAMTLWGVKAGVLEEPVVEGERIDIGHFLEPSVARLAANKYSWQSEPMKYYSQDKSVRLGASYDFKITSWDNAPADGDGINEIKVVAWDAWGGYNRKWNADDPDNILMPRYIELQVQLQMMMSGLKWVAITPLVAGSELPIIIRLPRPDIHAKIRAKVSEFWASIQRWRDDGAPMNWEAYAPAPDYGADYEAVSKVFQRPNPYGGIQDDKWDTLIDLTDRFMAARNARLAASEEEKILKAEIVATLGGAAEGKLPNDTKVVWAPSKSNVWTLRVTPAKE